MSALLPVCLPARVGCLLVREADGGVGGCCFSVDHLVAAFDGEAVVGGSSAVDAGVDVYRCWVASDGGVEGVGAGFVCSLPGVRVCIFLFDHGLGRERVSWLFAGVLCARVGDPCVCDGSEVLAGAQGDGGGVSALWAGVSSLVVVEGCVDGDSVVAIALSPTIALVRVCACARSCALASERASREGEHAVFCGHDGFTDQHVGERLLFALDPFVDLGLCECYADGGERLVLVAWGGEGAGGDVGVSCADGGGHGFALVEEDERQAGDGARVVGVDVEVCTLDDATVCVCAHVLTVCACARAGTVRARVAVCEGDGDVASVAQGDDVAVVAFHVAAVEELVEGGGELVCVAGGVLCGARWSKAVFDVVPRVHCWFLFLSAVSCLFSFVSLRLRVFFARVFLLVMVP